MTTIKEITIQEVGQPYSIKIERGQKGGHGYEIGVKSESLIEAWTDIIEMKNKIEEALYGGKDENQSRRDTNPV